MKYIVCLFLNLFTFLSCATHIFDGIPLIPTDHSLQKAQQFLEEMEKDSPQRAPSSPLLLNVSLKTKENVPLNNREVEHCNSCINLNKYCDSDEKISKRLENDKNDNFTNLPKLIVFVSFSLGDLVLQKLYRDTQKVGGQLVMRGLYKNSFRQTQKKIQELKIILDIDPTLFERFDVQEVPTFVMRETMDTETIPAHDKLKGNVSLTYALEMFEQAGNKEAGILLHKLREGSNE